MQIADSALQCSRTLAFNFSGKATAKPCSRKALNALQRNRLHARIAAITCSPPWTEFALAAAERAGIDPSANLRKTLRERGFYPPPADAGQNESPRRHPVQMKRCDACGRIIPPHNLAEHALVSVCDDCRIEPESDRESRLEGGVARAPGAHLYALLEGCDDEQTRRQVGRQRLSQIGLNEQEIAVLAFLIEGYSSRRIAKFVGRSQTFVRKVRSSAESKLCRSGLRATPLKFPEENTTVVLRIRTVDPAKLDAMASRRF